MNRLLFAFLLLISSSAALAQVDSSQSAPQPLSSPDAWIKPGDYPDKAQGQDETVSVLLRVDERGRVAECWLRQRAQFQGFNDLTCQLLTARARFRPAKDASGAPVMADYRHTVHWSPPEGFVASSATVRFGGQ